MTEGERTLIGYRMDRAREALNEAQLLLDHNHTHTSVNRLYYACFYAVSALLIKRGFSTSRHGHLRSVFHREFVKDGSIPTVMGKHFDKLFQNRQKSDYSDYADLKKMMCSTGWNKVENSFLTSKRSCQNYNFPFENKL